MTKLLVALIAAVALSPFAAAQLPVVPASPNGQVKLTLPSTGAYTTARAGDLSGNGHPDFLTLSGNRIHVMQDIHAIACPLTVPGTANDFDIWRSSLAPGHDEIVTTSAAGLIAFTYTPPTSAQPNPPGGLFNSRTISAASNWLDAGKLRVGALPGSIGDGFAAVGAGGQTIHQLLGLSNQSFTAGTSIPTGGVVEDFVLYDRDGDGDLEFAVLTGTSLEIYDEHANQLAIYPSQDVGGAICRIPSSGSPQPDQLAWITPEGPASPRQIFTRENVNGLLGTVALGPIGVVRCSAADDGSDGDQDIVLSITSEYAMMVLINDDGAFGSPYLVRYETNSSPGTSSLNSAEPVAVDIDHDGDVDYMQAEELSKQVFFAKTRTVNEDLLEPIPFGVWIDPTADTLNIVFPRGINAPAGATHIECVVYENSGGATNAKPAPYDLATLTINPSRQQTYTLPMYGGTPKAQGVGYFLLFSYSDGTTKPFPIHTVAAFPGDYPTGKTWFESLPQGTTLLRIGSDPNNPFLFAGDGEDNEGSGAHAECTPFDPDCPPYDDV